MQIRIFYLRYALLYLASFVCVVLLTNYFYNRREITAAVLAKIRQRRYVVAANLYNAEETLRDSLYETLRALALDAEHTFYLSIYENGSQDGTKGLLQRLAVELEREGVPHNIVIDNAQRGMPTLSDIYQVDWTQLRIQYLAELRNRALAPLLRPKNAYERSLAREPQQTYVLFVNDAVLSRKEVFDLLATHDGDYDQACAMDFFFTFYDKFASRDLSGRVFNPFYPYVHDAPSLQRIRAHEDVRVFTCWNGITVFRAEPFLRGLVRFRASNVPESMGPNVLAWAARKQILNDTTARELAQLTKLANVVNAVGLSECYYIGRDLWEAGYDQIYINPRVRVTFATGFFKFYVKYLLTLQNLLLKPIDRLFTHEYPVKEYAGLVLPPLEVEENYYLSVNILAGQDFYLRVLAVYLLLLVAPLLYLLYRDVRLRESTTLCFLHLSRAPSTKKYGLIHQD